MKRRSLLAAAIAALAASSAPAQTVLISELCDPRLNYQTDRFLEIANVGIAPVDLTGWTLVAVGNGVDIFTWNLSGTIAAGDALVAGDSNTVESFPVDFPEDAWSTVNGTWNGRVGDGAKLFGPGAVLVDIIVATGTTFENEDLTRNPDVLAPNLTYTPDEWSATPVDYPWQGTPGTHTTLPPPQGPIIANPVTDPAYPTASDAVHVEADVVDTVGTITSVDLFWGTDPDSITNVIAMAPLAGSTYRTNAPIPAQAQGTTVHYEVHATNDLPAMTVLGFLAYDVPYEVTIPAIQGMAASSPYDGDTILTAGVATGAFGSHFVLQSGAGAWNGIWVRSGAAVTPGDSLVVRGRVTESDPFGYAGNTLIDSAVVVSATPGGTVPAVVDVPTADVALEAYEGVLVRVQNAECTEANSGFGEWEVDDGSGPARIGDLADAADPDLGTRYDVTGCATFTSGVAKTEPRTAADVVWVSDSFAPLLLTANASDDTTVVVVFSEDVDETTAETPANYAITDLTVVAASRNALSPDEVSLTVSTMAEGNYTLSVDGVEDLYGNAVSGASVEYLYAPAPAGYYLAAEGMFGESLRAALHAIIDDHTVVPYEDTWLSFYTTDDRPDGTVWDMYSDVPGGTPPYVYHFGVDQGGVGGEEGTGYNREHSWPQAWFGGGAPMTSDLFQLYPTDNWVNNQRGSWPYGEVDTPAWTSLNGSKLGPCSVPGYTGTAFEPIDEYKGDFARSYFYMSARYYTEDAGWSTSEMTDGADLLPWAVDMLLEWHVQDPVSQKEIDRNGTIWGIQGNRNPFIDRPEFAERMLAPAVAVPDREAAGVRPVLFVTPNRPNPFVGETVLGFSVALPVDVRLSVYDVAGRLVVTLVDRRVEAGWHETRWDGRGRDGGVVAPGIYFYRVDAGSFRETRRMVRLR